MPSETIPSGYLYVLETGLVVIDGDVLGKGKVSEACGHTKGPAHAQLMRTRTRR